MENLTAILDCPNKIITFKFNDELFAIDLTEGDLEDSWNSFSDSNRVAWDINFSWEEATEDVDPSFCVYGVDEVEEGQFEINMDRETVIKIVKITGTKEEYFNSPAKPKKWSYSVSTSRLWASFDYGEVEADTYDEAMIKALEKLNYDFKKVNDILNSCDPTMGFSIEFNKDDIEIEEVN